jgi:antitoxin MazE
MLISEKSGGSNMPIVKVRENYQITLPAALRKKFKIVVGDYVETEEAEEGIIIRPVKVIRPDQGWFYTKEWQKSEEEADEAIAKGEVVGPFEDIKGALKALKKAKV